MPSVKSKSVLSAKLNGQLGQEMAKAWEATRGQEYKPDTGGDLPPGIEGAVAMLVDAHIGEYQTGDLKGKPFFMAAGVVMEPDEFNGIHVAGRRTQIGPEPLCPTPDREGKNARRTTQDHYDWVCNVLRGLGVADDDALHPAVLEETCAALTETKDSDAPIYFKFRTWGGGQYKGKDGKIRESRVNSTWGEAVAWGGQAKTTPEAATEDDTPEAPDEVPEAGDEGGAPEMELASSAAAADGGDKAAKKRLKELALEAGLTEEEVDEAESWADVAHAVAATVPAVVEGPEETDTEEVVEGEETPEEPVEEETPEEVAPPPPKRPAKPVAAKAQTVAPPKVDGKAITPKKGVVVKYRLRDAKGSPILSKTTRKPLKAADCEVMSVDPAGKTCTLKNLEDGKAVVGADRKPLRVKWSQLES